MKIAVLVGEASGDQLAAPMIEALRIHSQFQISGVGGPLLEAQGLKSLFDYQELSVMGIAEILPKIPHLLKRIRQAADHLIETKPDIVLSVDAPDFCKRVVKKARAHLPNTRFIHVVAPTVWAWRPGRAKVFAKLFDRLLCLFPFEPPYFEKVGLKADFIGHPSAQAIAPRVVNDPPQNILLLPGSRRQELNYLLSDFAAAIAKVKRDNPEHPLAVRCLTFPRFVEQVKEAAAQNNLPIEIHTGPDAKKALLGTGDLAIAASGTMALELAVAGIPHVIAFKLNWISTVLSRFLVKTPYAHIGNIVADRLIVPELLRESATTDNYIAALNLLLRSPEARHAQIAAFQDIRDRLWAGAPAAQLAARVIVEEMGPRSIEAPGDVRP